MPNWQEHIMHPPQHMKTALTDQGHSSRKKEHIFEIGTQITHSKLLQYKKKPHTDHTLLVIIYHNATGEPIPHSYIDQSSYKSKQL